MFDYIVNRVGPTIERKNTRFRRAIPVEQQVAIALRYVATGESYTSLEFRFRVSNQLISSIVPEALSAIYEVFKDEFMKCPSTPEEWKEVSTMLLRMAKVIQLWILFPPSCKVFY